MKYSLSVFILALCSFVVSGQTNRLTDNIFSIPDSIKVDGFYGEITITDSSNLKKDIPGIGADKAGLFFGYDGKQKVIKFLHFAVKEEKATGQNVYPHLTGHAWPYDWKPGETYPLLILTATDPAKKTKLYSGYLFLKTEKKWKLIATHKLKDTTGLKSIWPAPQPGRTNLAQAGNRQLFLKNSTWKAMDTVTTKPPSLRMMSNTDSLAQHNIEESLLQSKLNKDSAFYVDGAFYQILKEGNGQLVMLTDTITVHYTGSLYSDGSIFDQTKEKPATFPLMMLIKGWQVGLQHCKVGGKIRLYITSGSAYGIRTRSAAIPPNSILVFDVEVLSAKEKMNP